MNALKSLSMSAQIMDRATPPLYWNLIKGQRSTSGDLLYMKEHEGLTGYMGYFLFERGVAEVTAVVDPRYRNQGIFSELLEHTSNELRKLGIEEIQFRAPAHVSATHKTLNAIDASFNFAEYVLRCESPKTDFRIYPIKFTQPDESLLPDIMALHRIDELPGEEQIMVEAHFKQLLKHKKRACLIGYYHHEPIGIIHALINNEINLHDFTFNASPAHAHLKFDFLNAAIQKFQAIAQKPVNIIVKDNQWGCLDQFLRQGFTIHEIIEYWKIPLADHKRTIRKTQKLIN